MFYKNGVSGTGAQAISVMSEHRGENRTIPVRYDVYKEAMIGFPLVGCLVVWPALCWAGWTWMKANTLKEIEKQRKAVADITTSHDKADLELKQLKAEKEKTAAIGEDGGEENFGFGFDDEEAVKAKNEYYKKLKNKWRAKEDQAIRLREAKAELLELRKMPGYVIVAFALNLVLKTLPHIFLTAIFINSTSTNGVALYCFVGLLVDLALTLRVLSAWFRNKHPALELLVWIESCVLISSFLAWKLELSPFASTFWNKFGLATSIVFAISIVPILYACHLTLLKDKKQIEDNKVKLQKQEDHEDYGYIDVEDDLDIFDPKPKRQGSAGVFLDEIDETALRKRANASEDEPNLRVLIGTGVEALASATWLPTMFFAIFVFNTVPNVATFGVHGLGV
jgi:hypothetical protein